MPATRRSARLASSQASQNTSPAASQSSPKQAAGTKRKSEPGESPSAKRGKNANKKEQKTIEETLDPAKDEETKPSESKISEPKPSEAKEPEKVQKDEPKPQEHKEERKDEHKEEHQQVHKEEHKEEHKQEHKEEHKQEHKEEHKPEAHATPAVQKEDVQMKDVEEKPVSQNDLAPKPAESSEQKPNEQSKPAQNTEEPPKEEKSKPADKPETTSREEENSKPVEKPEPQAREESKPEHTATNGDTAVIPDVRKEEESSSILEKGIIYFLYRGRVGIDEPSNVNDIARSYIILRPLPAGAKLGDGPIGDDNNCRLLALPKKVLPLSGKDRWTAFVEKAKTSFKELRNSFLGSSDYETQTAGVRHSPAAVPAAEGVYAITSTGRESHLAYILTLPSSLGEVQNDLGLREKGSFITSVKNPQYPGPAYADIGKDPGYSQDILDEFRSLRWGPLQPKHLDYQNCQFLLVGESGGIDKATKIDNLEKNEEQPKEEMERLEGEDEIRVKHLHGDNAIFADLETDSKSYPGLQTTW